jgi:hypothetical protein
MQKNMNLYIPLGDISRYHLQKREVCKRMYKDLHGYEEFLRRDTHAQIHNAK